jgi:hypothetical protein
MPKCMTQLADTEIAIESREVKFLYLLSILNSRQLSN